jgi:medium-chain acyl-[acyl-carrier-protein] hydrolase
VSSSKWILIPKPRPAARARLFCFPFAGGGAGAYRPWAPELPEEIELVCIQPPGRENRFGEPRFTDMAAMVGDLADVITPWLDRPYAFFGHSMGTVVAYETIRALGRRFAPEPLALFASGRTAPHAPRLHPPLHLQDDATFADTIRHFNGTPAAILNNAEFLKLLIPLLRADITLHETYEYEAGPPLTGSLWALSGDSDPEVTPEELQQWGRHTTGPFEHRIFPGDHFYLQPQRQAVIESIVRGMRIQLDAIKPPER